MKNAMTPTPMAIRLKAQYAKCVVGLYGLAFALSDATAGASAKEQAINVFNWLYGMVGVLGGIILLGQILNWKAGNFLGSQDPKKQVINTIIAILAAFSVVAIIQALKSWAGSGNADIGSI